MQQPQVNSNQMLANLAKLVNQAKGTPQEQQVRQLIATLQQDPAMTAKFPQLAQISTEGRAWRGALLREADDGDGQDDVSQEDLSRSEIDKMFIQTAQHIADAGIDDTTIQPDSVGSSDVGGEGNVRSIDRAFDEAGDQRIHPEKLKKLIAQTPYMTANDQFAANKVFDMINRSPDRNRYSMNDLKRAIYHLNDKRLLHMSNNVKSMIVKAI